jgi:hypothetical protein
MGPVSGGAGALLRVQLCPTGGAVGLNNRRIHFRAVISSAPGYFALQQGDIAYATAAGWNGPGVVYTPSDRVVLAPEGTWTAFDLTVPAADPDAGTLTSLGINLYAQYADLSAPWAGTFYLDDIQLQ